MTELKFTIAGAHPKQHAASPAISFETAIATSEPVEALVLRAEVRIEPQRRQYDSREHTLLNDLFSTPDRWATTLRTFSWADVPVIVTAFEEQTCAHIDVPCTFDFDEAATRYFSALGEGDIPLRFFFSGAIFRYGGNGVSTERVPWSCEAGYRMPLQVWNAAMRACFGDDAIIRVRRETLEDLHRLRALSGAISWDDLFARLVSEARA